MLAFAKVLLDENDVERQLDKAVEGALQLLEAERGFLVITEDDSLDFRVVRNWAHDELADPSDHVSRSIVHYAVATDKTIFVEDAMADERFAANASVVSYGVRSVLAAPFRMSGLQKSVLYLERKDPDRLFSSADFERFEEILSLCRGRLERAIDRIDLDGNPEQRATVPPLPFEGVAPLNRQFQRQLEIAAEFAAEDDLPILVQGPNGTGKELVVRAIHNASRRAAGPLVTVNCGALARDVAEAELFGHTRGAFTGASSARKGRILSADGGTLYLDEVGELPLDLQAALLRALEQREVVPVGSDKVIEVDFRLICATNRNLEDDVKEGRFREDLFYRIDGITIEVPPLRRRPEDIMPLFRHFLASFSKDAKPPEVPYELERTLLQYNWPGNVRQLRREARRLALSSRGREVLDERLISPNIFRDSRKTPPPSLKEAKRRLVEEHLRYAQGNISAAARTLDMHRDGLTKLIRREGIDIPISP
jgi:transcriptional regulator with GAF, ATPase, and Fis domain